MSIFFPQTWSKTQYTAGSYVNGKWVEGTPTVSALIADIQPISGKELDTLTIGDRNIGKIKVYTSEALIIMNEGTYQSGDRVTWNGEIYELIGKQERNGGLITHIKYIGELRKNDNR